MDMENADPLDWPDEGVLLGALHKLPVERYPALPCVDIPQSVIDAVEDTAKNRALWRLRQRARQGASDRQTDEEPQSTGGGAVIFIEQMDERAIAGFEQRLDRLDPRAHGSQSYDRPGSQDAAEEVERIRELAADAEAASRMLNLARTDLAPSGTSEGRSKPRIRAAIERADALIDRIEPLLSAYHRFEVEIADAAMRSRRADCELQARRRRDLRDQIQGLEERLEEATSGWRRLLPRKGAGKDPARIAERLEKLKSEQAKSYELVDEHELRSWLDVLINACFYNALDAWVKDTRDTRLLFYQLLNVYSFHRLLEDERRAIDTLLRKDARSVMRYSDKGKQYLVSYFGGREPTDFALERHFEHTDTAAHLRGARETMLYEYTHATLLHAAPPRS